MDMHAAVGGTQGLTADKIEAALGLNESCELSGRERLVLEYTDRVCATPVDVSDEFFAQLRSQFSEREIVELTSQIAHENYNAKLNRPLRVESNNLCQIPLRRPEPAHRA